MNFWVHHWTELRRQLRVGRKTHINTNFYSNVISKNMRPTAKYCHRTHMFTLNAPGKINVYLKIHDFSVNVTNESLLHRPDTVWFVINHCEQIFHNKLLATLEGYPLYYRVSRETINVHDFMAYCKHVSLSPARPPLLCSIKSYSTYHSSVISCVI